MQCSSHPACYRRGSGPEPDYNLVKDSEPEVTRPSALDQPQSQHQLTVSLLVPRTEAMVGPRFEQTAEQFQPRPLAAIELIAQEPVIKVNARVVSCDGGELPQPC